MSPDVAACVWTQTRLPVTMDLTDAHPDIGPLGLGIRVNPRRAQLLVAAALAKHVPVPAAVPLRAAAALADRVRAGADLGSDPLVVGLAETATGLAELVAHRLGADVVTSTRHPAPPDQVTIAFEESHSHATSHRLQPVDPSILEGRDTVVVVDDELTTGATIVHLVAALTARAPVRRVVVACLLDARPAAGECLPLADGSGAAVVSLASAKVEAGAEAPERAAALAASLPLAPAATPARTVRWVDVPHPGRWARDGLRVADLRARRQQAAALADVLGGLTGRIDVLGVEEQIALPVLLADELARRSGADVLVHATTRTPAVAIDVEGYPLRSALACGLPGEPRWAYNTPAATDVTIIVPDGDTPVGEALLRGAGREVVGLRWT